MTVYCTGTSPRLKQSIRDFCLRESCVSPSKCDVIRARDERGNLPLLEEINSDEKYEEITKQFYTTNVCDWHKQWQYENMELLREECPSKGQVMTSRQTFTKYIPNHVQKKSYLSQFACILCLEALWMHQTMMKTLRDNHHCGDLTKCFNHEESMETLCTCPSCSNCLIIQLQSIPPEQLLHYLCRHDEEHGVPFQDCVMGECWANECFSDKIKRILNGHGCDTLRLDDIRADKMIYFYKFVNF